VFSASLEIVLTIAYREAVNRRHAYLTLEHLLYALAHDQEGERILAACGVDLPQLSRELNEFMDANIETVKRGKEREPEQTSAFRTVLRTALLHVQSAQRTEANAGDILAAIMQQEKSEAAKRLMAFGVTRLDILDYISHGKAKFPRPPSPEEGQGAPSGAGEEGPATSADPLQAYCLNLTERARQGQLDPLIGRSEELQRTIEVLCRRRKNNPVFVGDAGVGKTAMAEGLAARLLQEDVPEILKDAEIFSLDSSALLAGTRFRGDFEERFKAVVARMARIPARQASASDRERLRTLEETLQHLVFGQEAAVHAVAQSIKRSRAGLGMPDRPAGSFLFTGPTGVGKTELAKQLAIQLGNEFIRFDMSEYIEKHAVARLIGAPPGYVGFEQGGQLVDAVRTHPYSVVLLDEIEKAHPDIFNILLQVMDHATLTDNTGRKADFRNVVLILTSNAGSREVSAKSIGFSDASTGQNMDATLQRLSAGRQMQAVERIFSPEFRNRLDAIVTFKSLTMEVMETIVEKFVLQLEAQLAERRVAITLTPAARTWLASTGYDPVYGARPLARVIQREVRDRLTDEILFGQLEHGGTVTIGEESGALTFQFAPIK